MAIAGVRERGLLTLDDAAAYLSCSIRSFHRLVAAGAIPKVKIGSATRIVIADLDAYIERLRSEVE